MEAAAAAAAQQQEEKLLVEAKSVGEKFLVQYYKCASEENANLHKFYKTNAVSRVTPSLPLAPTKLQTS